MVELKVSQIGNSLGVVLPKDVISRLGVDKGDKLYLTESPEGFRITPYDPDFEDQMTRARKIMKLRRGALRELSK